MSASSGVWGGAQAEIEFGACILALKYDIILVATILIIFLRIN